MVMKAVPDIRPRKMRGLPALVAFLVVPLVLSPIALGLHLTGVLLLPAGLLYGVALPMTVLFVACLIKFSWEARILMVLCTGGLFVLALQVMKTIREKQRRADDARQERVVSKASAVFGDDSAS
ncbi:hypothetical protein [Prosthecobacter sp.]|uniref:hypothetical protein n=1 Tax=Prosthecobacter sp. TaxID=1965333 RepID=UPI0037840D4A